MAWIAIIAALRWNYHEYKHGRATICRITRHMPPWLFLPAYVISCILLGWHVWRGYRH